MYYLISDKLAADVTSLQWIDYDWGQLNDERPPVNFPCALIDIAYTECRNLTEAVGALDQLVNVASLLNWPSNIQAKATLLRLLPIAKMPCNRLMLLAWYTHAFRVTMVAVLWPGLLAVEVTQSPAATN